MIELKNSNIKASEVVSASSRYINQRVYYYGARKLVTFETYKRTPYVINGTEKVMLITKGVEYRPDLVSYDFYGFTDAWWRILQANNMYDIYDFKAGVTIMLPGSVA